MAQSKRITSLARETVRNLLQQRLARQVVYHNYRHTIETANAVRAIGSRSRLSDSDREILLLAAWFHDTGFVKSAAGHEKISASIASRFLRTQGYPDGKITRVVRCILATKMPRHPRNTLERILCDADLASLGKRSFFKQNEALRLETEYRKGRPIGHLAWLRRTLHFMEQVRYASRGARMLYENQRRVNLRRLRKVLRNREQEEARRAA